MRTEVVEDVSSRAAPPSDMHSSAPSLTPEPALWRALIAAWAFPWALLGVFVTLRIAKVNRHFGVGFEELIGLWFGNTVLAGALFGSLVGLLFALVVRLLRSRWQIASTWALHYAASAATVVGWVTYAAGSQADLTASGARMFRIGAPLAAALCFAISLMALRFLGRVPSLRALGLRLGALAGAATIAGAVLLSVLFVLHDSGNESEADSDLSASADYVGFPLLENPPEPDPGMPRLFVVGIDGLGWDFLGPLIEAGELPNFAALKESGVSGPLASMQPTLSPAIWTTVATGVPPQEHGIVDFAVTEAPGLKIDRLFRPGALHVTRPILSWVTDFRRKSISSRERRRKTLWNACTEAGVSIAAVGWWASWPAESIHGFMVTDHAYVETLQERLDRGFIDNIETEASTFPPSLQGELEKFQKSVADADPQDVEQFVRLTQGDREDFTDLVAQYNPDKRKMPLRIITTAVLKDRYYGNAALHLADEYTPDVVLGYFSSVDWFSHSVLDMSLPNATEVGYSAEDIRRYQDSVDESIRWMDVWLGEFMARMDEDSHLVVLSDHGFAKEPGADGVLRWGHGSAPPGIFLGTGPAFREGEWLETLEIRDAGPTLFYLSGLPVSEAFEGGVSVDAFRPEFLAEHPVRTIATYEAGPPRWGNVTDNEEDPELLNRLRALGYIE